MNLYLIEIEAYNLTTHVIETLRFSTGNGFMTQPGEVPPNVFYEPCVSNAGYGRFDIFDKGTTGGASRVSRGSIELVNVDGGLDYLLNYALDGKRCVVRVGQQGGSYPADYPIIETFTMAQPKISWSTVSIIVRDRQSELDIPCQANLYSGNNVLPDGLEGTDDLKGQTKPLFLGQLFNFSTPCCNTSKLIYQVNDGAVNNISAVRDRGISLTRGADYISQADMMANAPAAGEYRAWLAGGYFRLGSTPVGQVTSDAEQGAASANRTAAQLAKQIAIRAGGISTADINASDITALDALNSAECGLAISGISRREALDVLCRSVGAWWGFDRSGIFRIQRLEVPSGVPVAVITYVEIDNDIQIDSEGLPAWRISVKYLRNQTVQNSDLAGAVTADRRAWLLDEYRTVTAEDSAIKAAHPLAEEMSVDTCMVSPAAAATEATRLLVLYGADRVRFALRILDRSIFPKISLGDVVELRHRRFDLSAGRLLRIIGMQPDYGLNRVDLTLWG